MNFIPANRNFAGARMNVIELERAAREDGPPETRLCKDCKHCRPDRFFAIIAPFGNKKYQYADCAYSKSPVDGSPWRMCSTMRWVGHLCGPEGRFWEKR